MVDYDVTHRLVKKTQHHLLKPTREIMIKTLFFTITLMLPLTATAKSSVVFLKENPKAASTLKKPERVALCMAMNGAVAESTSGEARRKLNALNAIIWAFLEEDGAADAVEGLIPSAMNKLKGSSASHMLDSAGCKNLNESLVKSYNL